MRASLARRPDVANAEGVTELWRATTTPIVLMMPKDPLVAGAVSSQPHPAGNLVGCTHFDFPLVGGWL